MIIRKTAVKVIFTLVLIMGIFLLVVDVSTQGQGRKGTQPKAGATQLINKDVPLLHTRLGKLIQKLALKPEPAGYIVLFMETGSFVDEIERMDYFFTKKARATLTGTALKKLEFRFYRFGMTNTVRELKKIICTTPQSSDMSSLVVEFSSNIAAARRYTMPELTINSQKKIIRQYEQYLLELVHRLEHYRNQKGKKTRSEIDHIINLDKNSE